MLRLSLLTILFCFSLLAREFPIGDTIARIKEMISRQEKGAYLCFSEEDVRLAAGKTGDLWSQFVIQEVLSLDQDNVLKSRSLPYTALHGTRPGDRWAEALFRHVRGPWYAPLSSSFLSSIYQKECVDFFHFLRTCNILIVSDLEIPRSTLDFLFGSHATSAPVVEEIQDYTVVVLATNSFGKTVSKRLLDRDGSLFILDLSGLKEALCNWKTETWERWMGRVKILYTSALVPYKFEERKGEYIQCLKTLEEYGYRDRTYIAESGPFTSLSFFDEHCDHVLYCNTNDTSLINKGVNEAKSLQAAMEYFDFGDEDMIVKLTGRYQFNNDSFLRLVEARPEVDAFATPHATLGIATGCFAMRGKYLKRMLKGLDFAKMEKELIDIEREMEKFLRQMIKENATVVYLDKIGITANVANVVVEQW